MRKKITMTDSIHDVVVIMSEGNPGAINVLAEIFNKNSELGFISMLALDDMNIRGCQIWLGYKDFSGSDLDVFIENIKTRNIDMVNLINEMSGPSGLQEKAVVAGASFKRK